MRVLTICEDMLLKVVMMGPMKIENRVRWFQYL